MIEGFEKETEELNDFEKSLLPKFVAGLSTKKGKGAAITNKQMIAGLKDRGIEVGEARVRKIINHIRNTGLVEGLIATSKGYYVSNDIEEINKYIESLLGRESAIRIVREGFEAQIRRLKNIQP